MPIKMIILKFEKYFFKNNPILYIRSQFGKRDTFHWPLYPHSRSTDTPCTIGLLPENRFKLNQITNFLNKCTIMVTDIGILISQD